MRTAAVIFFLFLCFRLFGGNATAHASTHQFFSLKQSIENLATKNSYDTQNTLAVSYSNLNDESTSLSHIDYDDEDDEQIIRKQVFLVKCLVAFSHAFVLYYANKGLEGYPSFCKFLSHVGTPKYISQRVLRI